MNPVMFLLAQHMLSIWDPSRWDWYPNETLKKQKQLFYRARGIVLHDRALNKELDEDLALRPGA